MRVDVVDPPAFTRPYDHALCAALARAGADVRLVTSRFAHGDAPAPAGYALDERFYRGASRLHDARLRRLARAAGHVPAMLRYARAARHADVVHLQWLAVPEVDVAMLPRGRPLVLTAHDVLPREARRGQRAALVRAYRCADAVVVHTQPGRARLERLGVPPSRVHVIPHGAFTHLLELPQERPLAPELAAVGDPVVLFLGLLRPYKGLDVLLDAWHGVDGAELWVVGMPRMDTAPLRARAGPGVRFVERFVADAELPALLRRAELVVLPYREAEQSGVAFSALAFGRPLLLSDVGGFGELAAAGAAELVPPGDVAALRAALTRLLGDRAARERLAAGARAAAAERYGWDAIARRHLELYRALTGVA